MTRSERPWIGQDGWFRTIESYDAVTDLLARESMHADLVGTFKGSGIESGPVWECLAASLLSMNGAEHKRLRGLVGPWFTPKSVEVIRAFAADQARGRVRQLVTHTRADLVETFARPYVVAVTAEFVGLPADDTDRYVPLVAMLNSRHPDITQRLSECSTGLLGLVDYAHGVVARANVDGERVVSKVADLVRNGALTDHMAASFVAGLLSAGNDPTVNQIALGVDVLSERPDVWDALGSGDVEAASIVEEILRYRPTNEQVSRKVAASFVYNGVDLTEGEYVVMRLGSANHDPARFRRADDFDPVANRGSHLAFGFGAHYCLGAALARAQMQEALHALTSSLECPTVIEREDKSPGGIAGPVRMLVTVRERVATSDGENAASGVPAEQRQQPRLR